MWHAAPIFSTVLDYRDLMEPWTAESAPAAFRLTLACCVGLNVDPLLPPVCRTGKQHQNWPWLREWMEAKAFGAMPGTRETLIPFLLSWARATLVIDRQMMELHNKQVAYFSQKASRFSRWPNGAAEGEKKMRKVCSWSKSSLKLTFMRVPFKNFNQVLFLNVFHKWTVLSGPCRAFCLDQSGVPPSSAPKAALIDKVGVMWCKCVTCSVVDTGWTANMYILYFTSLEQLSFTFSQKNRSVSLNQHSYLSKLSV